MTAPATRRAVVLGAGGTLGAAWMVARLRALEEVGGWDARDTELVIGSSAGSVLASMIASGVSVQELLDHQRDEAGPENPLSRAGFSYDTSVGASLPERPPFRVGSPGLLAKVARHPRRLGAVTAIAAALPPGRGSLDGLRSAVDVVAEHDDQTWPSRPQLRVVAVDYGTGERVAFGAPDAPLADVVDAVVASCSIPGWFAPAEIDGVRYVDAGFRHPTSADLAAGQSLDEVIILAPLASYAVEDIPRSRVARLERRWRTYLTRVLEHEVSALDQEGARTVIITPSGPERAAMGANLMDHSRRVDVLEAAFAAAAAGRAS